VEGRFWLSHGCSCAPPESEGSGGFAGHGQLVGRSHGAPQGPHRRSRNLASTLSTFSVGPFESRSGEEAWAHVHDVAPAARTGAARSGSCARRAACGWPVRARGAARGRRPPADLRGRRSAEDVRGRHPAASGDQEPAGHDLWSTRLPRRARDTHPRRARGGGPARCHRCRTRGCRPRGGSPPASRTSHPAGGPADRRRYHPRDPSLALGSDLEPGLRPSTRRIDAAHALCPRPRRGHPRRRPCHGRLLRAADRPAAPGGGRGARRAPARDGGRRGQGLAGSGRRRDRRARPRRRRAPSSPGAQVTPCDAHARRARHGDPQRPPPCPRREEGAQATVPRGGATPCRGRPGRARRDHGRRPGGDAARPRQRARARDPRHRRDHHRPGPALARARRARAHRGLRPCARRGLARRAAPSPRRAGGPCP